MKKLELNYFAMHLSEEIHAALLFLLDNKMQKYVNSNTVKSLKFPM